MDINEWEIKTNNELELIFHKPNILKTIKSRRLYWADHAWRNQNYWLYIILEKDLAGKRPLKRPRMRWEDVVK